jgi:hypothetical protein
MSCTYLLSDGTFFSVLLSLFIPNFPHSDALSGKGTAIYSKQACLSFLPFLLRDIYVSPSSVVSKPHHLAISNALDLAHVFTLNNFRLLGPSNMSMNCPSQRTLDTSLNLAPRRRLVLAFGLIAKGTMGAGAGAGAGSGKSTGNTSLLSSSSTLRFLRSPPMPMATLAKLDAICSSEASVRRLCSSWFVVYVSLHACV